MVFPAQLNILDDKLEIRKTKNNNSVSTPRSAAERKSTKMRKKKHSQENELASRIPVYNHLSLKRTRENTIIVEQALTTIPWQSFTSMQMKLCMQYKKEKKKNVARSSVSVVAVSYVL